MKNKKYVLIIIGVALYVSVALNENRVPVEELETVNGIGYDIEKISGDIVEYSLPLSVSILKANGSSANLVYKESGNSIGEVTQKRQQKMSKKFVQGQEKVVLISENYARYGIKTMIEDRFRNPEVSDMAYVVVCKGKPEEYFNYKAKGYSNAASFIEGLIESSELYNFYSNDYKLIDCYVRIGAEGRDLILPYIEMRKQGIELTGSAVFKGDKMITLTNEEDTKMLNLLKSNNVQGILSLQVNPKEYIDFAAKKKNRRVRCSKEGDKYIFNIDIKLTGSIVNNEMYPNITKDKKQKEKFEKDLAESVEKKCQEYIKLMQIDHKVDCVGLGKDAAARFGRRKNIDWHEEVSKAEIKVNVKVKVDTQGRGDY